jgi:hypothetical protein
MAIRRITNVPIRGLYAGVGTLRYSLILGNFNNKTDELMDQRVVCFNTRSLLADELRQFMNDADEFAAAWIPISFTNLSTGFKVYRLSHQYHDLPLRTLCKKYGDKELGRNFMLYQKDRYPPNHLYTTTVIIQRMRDTTIIGDFNKEGIVYSNALYLRKSIMPVVNV